MRAARVGAAVTAALLCIVANARGQNGVPAEFQGDWVPASATCDSAVRFIVTETRMNLINGTDAETYGDVTVAHSFFGPDYQGISVACMPEIDTSHPPFTVFFNADEQKGVARVDIDPQHDAIQAAAKKLAERFPLNAVPLKKCGK